MATIEGTSNPDTLSGSPEGDTINGGAGDDQIWGLEGDDLLTGNGGDDTLLGDDGNDVFQDSEGSNKFYGLNGDDVLQLSPSVDAINYFDGGPGNDRVNFSFSLSTAAASNIYSPISVVLDINDSQTGASTTVTNVETFAFQDRVLTLNELLLGMNIVGGLSDDLLAGGFGKDTIFGDSGYDTLFGGAGNDSLDGGDGNDSVIGGDGIDILLGGAGDDTLIGGAGSNSLDGGSGNNLLIASPGSTNSFMGGPGADTIQLDGNRADYEINFSSIGYGPNAETYFSITTLNGTTLGNGSSIDYIKFADSTVAVTDLFPTVTLKAHDLPAKYEGDSAIGATFAFTASIKHAPNVSGTLRYGWGVGNDHTDFYNGWTGAITFTPFSSTAYFTVNVSGDALIEKSEEFEIRLYALGDNVAVASTNITVLNDDTAYSFINGRGPGIYYGATSNDVLPHLTQGFRGVVEHGLDGQGFLMLGGPKGDKLSGIEQVKFADGSLHMGIESSAAKVYRLYVAGLDRGSDQPGQMHWTHALDAGALLKQLAQGFLTSPEFTSRFGGADTSADTYVSQLYRNVLHREGEQDGMGYWKSMLTSGVLDRADVLMAFSDSAENKAGTANTVAAGIWVMDKHAPVIGRLYDTVFGRLPDEGGMVAWNNALYVGAITLKGMATGFMQSKEFAIRFGNLSDSDFVENMYAYTLHRGSDAQGKASWLNALNTHVLDRADIVLGFSESLEHQNNTYEAFSSESNYGILFA